MEKRQVGKSSVEVSPLMIGGAVFGWTVDRPTTFAILDRFFDAGYNGIDTSEVYSGWVPGNVGGESETEIGAWIAARGGRDRMILSTKLGGSATSFESGGTLTAAHLIQAVEGSLKRLQTDFIDICHSHIEDKSTPIEETLEAYEQLVTSGKIRIAGGSNYSLDGFAHALEAGSGPGRYQSYQPQYSLMERSEFESGYSTLCLQHDVGVLCHSSLAKGFLTGNLGSTDADSSFWGFMLREYQERGQRVLASLRSIAERQGRSSGEIALAWLLAQPGVSAAIFSVERTQQLDELVGAGEVRLTPEDVAALTVASEP